MSGRVSHAGIFYTCPLAAIKIGGCGGELLDGALDYRHGFAKERHVPKECDFPVVDVRHKDEIEDERQRPQDAHGPRVTH